MTDLDVDRQKLARDLVDLAAKVMKEAALLARIAARMADPGYPLPQATGTLRNMTHERLDGNMLAPALKPLAERARQLCDRAQMAAKVRRRLVEAAVEDGNVARLPVRGPPTNGYDHPDGAA